MRDKVWKNCPSCGSENSMQHSQKLVFQSKKLGIHLKNLQGYECGVCHDAIFTTAANNRVQAAISRAQALRDAEQMTPQLMLTADAAKELHVSVQAIHKMMQQGRLAYVLLAGKLALPRKDAVFCWFTCEHW